MPSPSEPLTELKNNFDRIFFSPLDKLKEKFENADLENSILFTPLDKLKDKVENNPTFFAPLDKLKEKVEANSRPSYEIYNDDEYINAESALGRTIFGPIPAGHQREFFREKKNIWVWHENWTEFDEKREITIRYEVRKDGVYKKPLGKGYARLEGEELENFRRALHLYLDLVKKNLYH